MSEGNNGNGTEPVKRELIVPNIHDFAALHFKCKEAADELEAIEDATPTQRGLALLLRGQAMNHAMRVASMEQQHRAQRIVRPNIITPSGGFGRT